MKFFLLIVKNVGRNPLRSILTVLGSMVLVMVVTLVWSFLSAINLVMTEKKEDLKAIVTDRWVIPSRLPADYERPLSEGAARPDHKEDVRPIDYMTWQFYVGTLDKGKLTRENFVIAVAMDPAKVTTMMDGLDSLTGQEKTALEQLAAEMKTRRQGLVVGQNVLRSLNKRLGERVKVYGLSNFKGLDFEFEILGTLPPGQYDNMSVMNRDFYTGMLEKYKQDNRREHLMASRPINLVWLKLADTDAFTRVAKQIDEAPQLRSPTVKCETVASSIGSMIDASFRDILWGLRWLLAPACLVSLSSIQANAISISVRERRAELAVLKVLGYRPWQILVLVLGESLLLGGGAGLASSGLTYAVVNWAMKGLPLGFFGRCFIPVDALWWGALVGAATSLAGSLLPAWSARNVKVADVFAKVA